MLDTASKVNSNLYERSMNSIIVQIYEVQTPAEAEILIDIGVDHIGSVVLSEAAWQDPVLKETVSVVRSSVARSSLIPLFSSQDAVFRAIDYYQPHIVHFCEDLVAFARRHGSLDLLVSLQENTKKRFPEIAIMRSIPIPVSGVGTGVPVEDTARTFGPVSDYFLTDTLLTKSKDTSEQDQPVGGFVGITGTTCDWDMALRLIASTAVPVILAGGISQDNVYDGIMRTRPAGVDSCTRTNAVDAQGHCIRFQKDIDKVRRLVSEARRAEKDLLAGAFL